MQTGLAEALIFELIRLAIFLLFLSASAQCAEKPSLFQLKQLAESGDIQAEFDYGSRIELSNPAECAAMIVRAAESGYGPAENWAGNYFSLKLSADQNLQKQYRRQGVKFTARAAYRDIPQSQIRLSSFYQTGDILPRDPALAYGWAAIAIRSSRASTSPITTIMYQAQLDRLIANITTPEINEGQKFADAFKPQTSGMTRVEADLISLQLKLTGFMDGNPILNGILMKPGVANKLQLDGASVDVVCLGVKRNSAQFQFLGSNFFVILPFGQPHTSAPVVRSW